MICCTYNICKAFFFVYSDAKTNSADFFTENIKLSQKFDKKEAEGSLDSNGYR